MLNFISSSNFNSSQNQRCSDVSLVRQLVTTQHSRFCLHVFTNIILTRQKFFSPHLQPCWAVILVDIVQLRCSWIFPTGSEKRSGLQGVVQHFGKNAHSFSRSELHDKVNTTMICPLGFKIEPRVRLALHKD